MENKDLIEKIKQKREFSRIPDSIVSRAIQKAGRDVKDVRALLRKYFGVFLTNKVLKGDGSPEDLLVAHVSSRKRNYKEFYEDIFEGTPQHAVESVIDLGAGMNGFSYCYLKNVVGGVDYVAVEAAGQEVEHMNNYFEENGFPAKAVCEDLFDIPRIKKILIGQKKDRIVFLFQVVDALENLERDFSKKFIMEISKECEWMVISLPTESLGGRKKFAVQRKWIVDFLKENFMIEKDFRSNGERIIRFRK
jgi:hypothetical protein